MAEDTLAGVPAAQTLVIQVDDGHRFELIHQPAQGHPRVRLYWLPAMGVPARHYRVLAAQLATHGVSVILHEWRGIGSSSQRASRHQDWNYQHLLHGDIAAGLQRMAGLEPAVPRLLGGHSLGGQLSVMYASLHPAQVDALLLVGSGAPYWRRFRWPWLVWLVYQLAAPLARWRGYFPGRRLGFAGNEARGVIADWARSGRRGRYLDPATGLPLTEASARVELPLLALVMAQDWLAPEASLAHLQAPLHAARGRIHRLDARTLGLAKADHFSWMEQPQAMIPLIVDWLASWLNDTGDDRRRSAP